MSASARRRMTIWTVLKWAVAIMIAVIAVFPVWWMVNVVFSLPGEPVSINPRLWPTSMSAGIDKIRMIFAETGYMRAYGVSLVYAGLTIFGVLLVGSLAAFEFALFEFRGKNALFAVILLSLMVPTAATIIPTYLLTSSLGWLNSMQGLVVPGLASAFGLFMLVQFMRAIPRDMIEAARLDGANHFQIYWFVALPLSRNALITLAILTFMQTLGKLHVAADRRHAPRNVYGWPGGRPLQRAVVAPDGRRGDDRKPARRHPAPCLLPDLPEADRRRHRDVGHKGLTEPTNSWPFWTSPR